MAPRKQSGPGSGPQARTDQRHAVRLLALLAAVRDPFVVALGLTNDQASQHPLPLSALRSAALVLVCRRPELAAGDLRELAEEAGRLAVALLEVDGVDDGPGT